MSCFRKTTATGLRRGKVRSHAPAIRRGVTLIELLIVVGVLTILATVSLQSVKGLLKDQKVTQATRLTQQYIESAKIRAITTGRPVAVFLERVSLDGDQAGGVVVSQPQNYTATRLSMGEVFPPYTGDAVGATGTLWDVQFGLGSPDVRINDGYADQIRIPVTDVVSGFGTPGAPGGFVSVGDLIEFPGTNRFFSIEQWEFVQNSVTGLTEVAITFFNPPASYNLNLTTNGFAPPGTYFPAWATEAPALPLDVNSFATGCLLSGGASPQQTLAIDTPGESRRSTFRIYRRPKKSLVGAITMPRGTGVDLFHSGTGETGSANDGGPFAFIPPAGRSGIAPNDQITNLSRDSYSRVAIVFDRTGKASGIFRAEKLTGLDSSGTPASREIFDGLTLDSKLYLLIGRTDQVFSGPNYVRPAPSDKETPLSNLLDPANSWVVINPLTGSVDSAPVSAVEDPVLASALANSDFGSVVDASRALSSVGVNNAGQ